MKVVFGLVLLFLAYALLYPGLTQPVLTLTGTVAKADLMEVGKQVIIESPDTNALLETVTEAVLSQIKVSGDIEAYNKTRSIIGTIRDLYNDGFVIVAFLVGLFSIVIPVAKGLMLLVAAVPALSTRARNSLRGFSNLVSKWSMADVFVVGVFVAFLAANAVQREGGLLTFNAELGSGFYFFLGYCLVSILASQLLAPVRTAESGRQSA